MWIVRFESICFIIIIELQEKLYCVINSSDNYLCKCSVHQVFKNQFHGSFKKS